jgi:adenosylcobinamide-GDP ribazoletransferase
MAGSAALTGHNPVSGALAAAAAGLAVGVLVYRSIRRLGGVTGDVMGAAIEIAFTVMIIGVII